MQAANSTRTARLAEQSLVRDSPNGCAGTTSLDQATHLQRRPTSKEKEVAAWQQRQMRKSVEPKTRRTVKRLHKRTVKRLHKRRR
jgi:hypothetical protein